MKIGEKSEQVKIWQKFLISLGYTLVADGDFGENTDRATRSFQAKNHLREDGVVGENTLKAARNLGFVDKFVEKVIVEPTASEIAVFATSGNSEIDRKNEAHLAKVAPTLQRRGRSFIAAANAAGVTVQIVQGFRTFAEQDALYAQGRTKPGKPVTNARGGQSLHNYGLAIDACVIKNGKITWDEKEYRQFGEFAKTADLEWGGDWKTFKDLPHVQIKSLPSYKVILEVYKKEGLSEVWKQFS